MADPDISVTTLGQLLALLAHDLRNPLSAIHSNVGFLNSVLGNKNEEVSEALSDGLISCDGLSHIIDNIDLLGQVLRDAPNPSQTVFALGPLTAEAVQRCRPIADSHGIQIEFDAQLAQQDEHSVLAARDAVSKSVGNLIRNAIQHSPPGGTVNVSLQLSGATLRVEVQDTGTPIAATDKKRMFSAEGQISAKASSEGRYSRGLGLYVARLAAELAGATVSVSDAPGGHNTLALELPARGVS